MKEQRQKMVLQRKAGFWLFSLVFFLLILAVLLVLNRSESVLRSAQKERKISDVREKLMVDLKLLQKSAINEIQLGSFLYNQMMTRTSELVETKDWPEKLSKYLNGPFCPLAGKSQWQIMSFEKSRLASETMFADKRLHVKIAKGHEARKNGEALRLLCIKGIQTFSNLYVSDEFRKFAGSQIYSMVDGRVKKNQTDFIRSALGRFQKILLHGRQFYLAWFPLLQKKWMYSVSRFNKLDMQNFDSRDLSLLHMKGAVLVLIDEKNFTAIEKKYLKGLIKVNLARGGCDVDFFNPLEGAASIKSRGRDNLTISAELNLEKKYLVSATRAIEPSQTKNSMAIFSAFLLKLIWVTSGLWFWGIFFWMGRKINLNLSTQLIIFTLWLLFPAFYLGFNATERYVLEKQTSTLAGLKKAVESQVRAMDSSIDLYKTWVCKIIDQTMQKYMARNAFSGNETDNSWLLRQLKADLISNGVFSKNIFIVDGSGKIYSDLFGASKKEKRFFEEFFRAFYLPVINEQQKKQNNTTGKKEGSRLLASAQAEELVEIARQVLSPEDVSSMAMKTVSLDRLGGLGQQSFIFHRYLGRGQIAYVAVQVGIYMQSLERNCLLDWVEFFAENKLEKLVWMIARRNSPSWLLRPPFWRQNSSGLAGQLGPVYDFLPPKLLFLQNQLIRNNSFITGSLDLNGEEFLFSSSPGRNMIDYQFSAMLPLGDYRLMLREFRQRLLWAMAIIFLLSAIIGVKLAQSFIAPVKNFAEKAGNVLTGNFRTRMPMSWEEEEFAALAENFNQVVTNLESGKTLTKFVSDGALEKIRSPGELEASCTSVEQVVMFLRLDQFWQKAEKMTPEQGVYCLNGFFTMVCQQIKNAGGDVSKFIGEKVLAVFKTDAADSHLRALKCACKIQDLVGLNPEKYMNCRVRIGISRGVVISGIIGDENSLLEQTVIGDSVNLASRLCTIAAQDQILINLAMANSLFQTEFATKIHRLPEQAVKGKKSPVVIFSVKGYPAG